MDFGLAKLKGSLKITKSSSTIGTLAYMAPEQIQGGEVDARSDIFSFGVVLYEMLTGQYPFKGDYEAALMYSILNEEAEPIEKYIPDISSELLHIINRSLEKDPENRYQSIKDIIIDLHRLKRDTVSISKLHHDFQPKKAVISKKRKFRDKKIIIPAIVILAILISGVSFILSTIDSEDFKPIPIAVVDFINETNEPELNGLSGMLITALEQSKKLSVLTRSRMFDILKQMNISEIDKIDESLGRKICNNAKINAMATATIRKFGKLYTIDFKVLNVDRNEYLFTSKEQGEGQENIPTMIDNLSDKVHNGFKEEIPDKEVKLQNVAEITSPNLDAYQHYFKGEELIDKLDFKKAIVEFKNAIALDSTFGLAYYRLAYAVDWEMNPQHSAQYISKAISLIHRIPEKERYLALAQATNLDEGRPAAIKSLIEMEKIYPNDKEMLYNIGDWSYHVGDFVKAQQYLEKVLIMDPHFIRALQHLTWTYMELGLYEKMLEAANSYVMVSESEESYNLLAEAYIFTGEFEKGLKSLKLAQELNPDRYFLNCSIAGLYYLLEEYDKAEKELKILVEKDKPVEIQKLGYEYLSRFYPYVGKYREAINACDYLIDFYWQSRDTSLASYWQIVKGLGMINGWNDLNSAWKEAKKTFALQNQINYTLYWTTITLLYVAHGDYTLADSLAATSTTINWWYLSVRSIIHAKKQECYKSQSLADTVLQITPGFGKILVLYHLAKCQYKQGNLDKAVKLLLQLQSIYDISFSVRAMYYPKSFYLLGKIYEKKKDKNQALKKYQKFLDLWKNADKDLPELIDAQKRLAGLTKGSYNDR
jgi:tetratricopeptide (TPR) repeat protein